LRLRGGIQTARNVFHLLQLFLAERSVLQAKRNDFQTLRKAFGEGGEVFSEGGTILSCCNDFCGRAERISGGGKEIQTMQRGFLVERDDVLPE
jgi:hypothetical protein